MSVYFIFFFFFQAEDGIRDYKVTGVQTCALPISGLSTTVLPQINAGASFQAGIALGKFQGVIRPTTPMGLRMANMWTRSRSEGTSRPGRRARRGGRAAGRAAGGVAVGW